MDNQMPLRQSITRLTSVWSRRSAVPSVKLQASKQPAELLRDIAQVPCSHTLPLRLSGLGTE